MVIKWIIGHPVLELTRCIHPLRTSSIGYRMFETIRINRLGYVQVVQLVVVAMLALQK